MRDERPVHSVQQLLEMHHHHHRHHQTVVEPAAAAAASRETVLFRQFTSVCRTDGQTYRGRKDTCHGIVRAMYGKNAR